MSRWCYGRDRGPERRLMTVSADLKLTKMPTVNVGMLIRRPPEPVFAALVDPAITTRFWFTKSSGKLGPGAKVQWDWEMYGVSAEVSVKEFEEHRRIVFDWGPKGSSSTTTVEIRFIPWQDDTYIQVTESGFQATGDEVG